MRQNNDVGDRSADKSEKNYTHDNVRGTIQTPKLLSQEEEASLKNQADMTQSEHNQLKAAYK